ncbi:MAG: GFA family protein [Deltaproteobacteria bacterium]|nr:GFA family protein [Deltaproteobacteria bacterium]MBW2402522.1 GFA family protein [Deltaproteobacteria bacterium]MBW2546423.1 GFA family protein [Deltaproteobacteria bacterium]MBW2717814.1 GFA family protein [Deltaproteobacteria bacterium]RLB45568.1 MAG: GFA family protein [Deltaproteobacteria bacterium]
MARGEPQMLEGGCHCGAVRYRVTVRSHEAVECNCSVCAKKGYLHLIVPEADFELLRGATALTTYTFGTETAQHHFCRHCGVHSYYRPRSHPDQIDVNIRCLDGVDLSDFQVSTFDGRNWEDSVEELRARQRARH